MSVAEIFESMDYGPAPESRAEVDAWLDGHARRFGHFIDGAWRQPAAGGRFETRDPATGSVLAAIAAGNAEDVDLAVAAASTAQRKWAATRDHDRARALYALARLVQKHARMLAVLETLDNGKPIRESRDIDVPLVVRHFYHHAGWAQLLSAEFPDQVPVGVVGQIIPWNFPLLMLAWKIAPALAAGNAVVIKPAEYTSLSALRFAEICQEAGLPPGLVNIVTGDGDTGAAIVTHPGIDKIAFTGSTEVGREIRQKTAGSGKKLSLELGGKSAFILFDDADLDSAVEGVVDAIWFNQGQVCCAGSRLLVQESVVGQVIDKLKARMARLRVGDPLDKGVDMGAIVDPIQRERIRSLVDQGVKDGATLWQANQSCPTEGCFYPPSLLTDVAPASALAQEEIFGPVLVAMSFRTPDEAVMLANDSRYGLAASVWTENINLALDVAPAVKAGVIWINCTNQFDAAAGFGGYRESGFGREGGREGMIEYLKPAFESALQPVSPAAPARAEPETPHANLVVDRTPKLYIGGKQARPDGGYSRPVRDPTGRSLGLVGEGSRKDIRDAVEAARKAAGWATAPAHGRAQILYYIAENLAARSDEFARVLVAMTGCRRRTANAELRATIDRLFCYGAWADKFDGAVHGVPIRGVAMAMHEPVGIIGIACPALPALLGLVSVMAPAIAMGNRVVIVPSTEHPLSATDFYQVLDTSDVPAGVVNIVTGDRESLSATLAAHDQVDGIWYFGSAEGSAAVEGAAADTIKRTWVDYGRARNWSSPKQGEGREFLRHATEIKNIWIPYGE